MATPVPPSAPVAESKKYFVLGSSTLAFTVCFTIWMMFGVVGIPIKTALQLNETQFGLLTAMPRR